MTDAARSRQPGTASRDPVRILLQGGVIPLLGVGTVWRISQIDTLYEPSGIIGQDPAKQTVIDLAPVDRAQPDGPQEIDAAKMRRVLDDPKVDYLLHAYSHSKDEQAEAIAAAYRAQQPEGGAEGEGRA